MSQKLYLDVEPLVEKWLDLGRDKAMVLPSLERAEASRVAKEIAHHLRDDEYRILFSPPDENGRVDLILRPYPSLEDYDVQVTSREEAEAVLDEIPNRNRSKYFPLLGPVERLSVDQSLLVLFLRHNYSSSVRGYLYRHLPKDAIRVQSRTEPSGFRLLISKTKSLPPGASREGVEEGTMTEGPLDLELPFDGKVQILNSEEALAQFTRPASLTSDQLKKIEDAASQLPAGRGILLEGLGRSHVGELSNWFAEPVPSSSRERPFKVKWIGAGGDRYYVLISPHASPGENMPAGDSPSKDASAGSAPDEGGARSVRHGDPDLHLPRLSCQIRVVEAKDNLRDIPRVFPPSNRGGATSTRKGDVENTIEMDPSS